MGSLNNRPLGAKPVLNMTGAMRRSFVETHTDEQCEPVRLISIAGSYCYGHIAHGPVAISDRAAHAIATNCRNCGASRFKSGRCEYCGSQQ